MTSELPNPGSKKAQDLGCTCAVMDNHYGSGLPNGKGGVDFWISGGCPLHGETKPTGSNDGNQ